MVYTELHNSKYKLSQILLNSLILNHISELKNNINGKLTRKKKRTHLPSPNTSTTHETPAHQPPKGNPTQPTPQATPIHFQKGIFSIFGSMRVHKEFTQKKLGRLRVQNMQ